MEAYLRRVCRWLDDMKYHELSEGLPLVDGKESLLKHSIHRLRRKHGIVIETYKEKRIIKGYKKISGKTADEIADSDLRRSNKGKPNPRNSKKKSASRRNTTLF